MPEFTQIIRSVGSDKFIEIFGASSRKAREARSDRGYWPKPARKPTNAARPGVLKP